MIASLLLALGFFFCAVVETSFIHALPMPFVLFPFMLLVGTLVMHRADRTLGALWIALAGVVAQPWGFDASSALPYIVAAASGYLLTAHVFTIRSVYALLGLGLSMQVIVFLGRAVERWILGLAGRAPFLPLSWGDVILETLLFLIGLLVGSSIMRRVYAWGERTFFFHA